MAFGSFFQVFDAQYAKEYLTALKFTQHEEWPGVIFTVTESISGASISGVSTSGVKVLIN